MQQSIGNNRISLIVNNHIQQFEIKAPILQFQKGSLKPPLQRGNAHYGVQPHKKNQSLSIQHNGAQHMTNHLKIIPTNNNKKTKLFNNNINTSNNISKANSLSNQVNSNHVNSFHRPQSPMVLNISSDRHQIYQQQQQYSFQSKNSLSNNNPGVNSQNQIINQIGVNIGQHPLQRDRVLNFRRNSIKLKGKIDNSKHIGSINVLQSINSQKNNISYLNDSPITKSQNCGISSSNDQISDLEKVNNSSSNPNTNNGTIMNINTSSISNKNLNNSSSTNNQNNSSSINNNNNNNNNNSNNYNTNTNNNNHNNKNNNNLHRYNYSINNINKNNNNFNSNINQTTEQNISNQNYNNNSSLNREKKYRISKTQILFPFVSRESQSISNNQNTGRSLSKNITNSKIINNPKIVNNQNFQEDEILYNKAASQPTEILREQMALVTPPQLAAYTTSATTDTLNRQTFRIRPYNMSSRQSSRGALKSTITSNGPISSVHQDNNITNENQIFQINDANLITSNNDLTDLSQNIINQNKQPQTIQRIFSSRSQRRLSQNIKSKLIRQPSSNIIPDDISNNRQYHPYSNNYHPQLNGFHNHQSVQNQGIQKEIIVRKNSYWFNQREQQEKKKKKEKSILTSNNDVSIDGQNQNTEPIISVGEYEEEKKNQHFLFKIPLNEDKMNNQGKDMLKNDQTNQKREVSPKGINQKLSKRQSITRINSKQQQMITHQLAPNEQVQYFPLNGTIGSHPNQPSLFSLSNNILNMKTLSIKKASSIENSKNLDDMILSGTNPYHDVELRELLGEGAYGKVYKGFMKKTGKFIAVKQLKLSHQGLKENNIQEKLEQYLKEITLLNHLEHPNIVRYYDCKQEQDYILIYMEQMPGGSLSQMLQKFGRFEEELIKKFVKQIIQGLAYLHSQGVVHRDIKGANILSDGNGTVKLADFGAARYRDNLCLPNASGSEFCNSIKGSLYWMAPELLNQEPHGRKSDIWSLGCTMIEMATGKHPWPDCKAFFQLALIVKTEECPPIPEHLSDVCKDFIRKCCTFDKKERPTSDKLLQHPFLQD